VSLLLERDGAIESVRRVLARAAAGRGGAVFVIGEAGLGKTAVLDHAVRLADGFRIGVGRGDLVEATLPFGLVGQALDPLLAGDGFDARLLEPPAGGADVTAAARFWSVVQRLRAVAVQPLLLALDDLQWADPDSLALVHLLCRRVAALPVAIIGAARPWPDPALRMAEELQAQEVAAVERLAPLSDGAADAVLRARVGAGPSDAALARAVALCGGNPLLLVHLADALDAAAEVGDPRPPAATEPRGRFLLARFLGLREAERRYLRAASVLGTRFRPAVAAELAALGAAEAADILDALFRAGLVREADGGWAAFAHDLVRQAIYDELSAPTRAHLHEAAFRALAARGAGAAETAEHAIAARLSGDPEAIATLARAGREALHAGAAGAARRHFEAAVELAGDAAPAELLGDLATALLAVGDNEASVAINERLLRRGSVPVEARTVASSQLGRAAFMLGRAERAATWFEAAARLARERDPRLGVAVLLDHAFWSWACLGPRAGLPVATRARELATATGSPLRACADAAWGLCAYGGGDPRGAAVARAAAGRSELVAASPAGEVHWALEPAGVPGDVAVWAERFDEAERLFQALLRSAEVRGNPFALFHATFSWTDGLCRLGRLDDALAWSERVFELAEVVPMALPFAIAGRALALLERGRLGDAAACCERLARLATGHRWFLVTGYDLHRRGTLALRSGDLETACRLFGRLEGLADQWGLLDPCCIPWAADAISAYVACDRVADARRVVDWLEPRAAVLPGRWPRVVAATGRAALAAQAGDHERADHHYAEAVALQAHLPLPLSRAETLIQYGAFLVRTGRPARARPLLDEALRIAEQHGAGWHAERARTEWRRAGGRARPTPAGRLTPQEAAVARLVRAGRTNRQIARQLFLSEHTVETHVAHVYRKLGIRRRWELIARPDHEVTER
jgi:DNA-binding CsgD family transcriptional regulator